ncbi:hypothetical protein [Mesomycoplasma ovipneumoniae]
MYLEKVKKASKKIELKINILKISKCSGNKYWKGVPNRIIINKKTLGTT